MKLDGIRGKSGGHCDLIGRKSRLTALLASYPESQIEVRQTFAAFTLMGERLGKGANTFSRDERTYRVKQWAVITLEPYFVDANERGVIFGIVDHYGSEEIRQTMRLLADLAEENSTHLYFANPDDELTGIAEAEGFVRARVGVWRRAKAKAKVEAKKPKRCID